MYFYNSLNWPFEQILFITHNLVDLDQQEKSYLNQLSQITEKKFF